MRQELNDVDQVSEISNLGNGVKQIKIKDDLKQSFDSSILPINDHCDFKDKKVFLNLICVLILLYFYLYSVQST